jgi:hypothetical protein
LPISRASRALRRSRFEPMSGTRAKEIEHFKNIEGLTEFDE